MPNSQVTALMAHVVGFILFFGVGLLGTFWPRAVQAYELELYSKLDPFDLGSFIRGYIQSDVYLWQMRLIGTACLIAAGVLLRTALG
jgi:hypothetical protein